MKEDNQLTVQDPPDTMLAVISRAAKDPTIDVEKMERLLAMGERMEGRQAEKDFNSSFVALQQKMPVIVASSIIPNRGKYERFEDVMKVVGPLLQSNGFAVSFSQAADDKRITVTCHLRHISGHSQDTDFSCRFGKNADSDTQSDCKASTTAKRNSLLQALNIVIRQDCLNAEDDPTMGDDKLVTKEQADEIRRLVKDGRFDEKATLEWLDATSYESIAANRYEDAVGYLKPKKGAKLGERDADGNFKF